MRNSATSGDGTEKLGDEREFLTRRRRNSSSNASNTNEQLTAWSTYDSTAQTARQIRRVRDTEGALRRSGRRRSSVHQQHPDVDDWSQLIGATHDDWMKEIKEDSDEEQEAGVLKDAPVAMELPFHVKEAIYEIFGVYFQNSFDSYDNVIDVNQQPQDSGSMANKNTCGSTTGRLGPLLGTMPWVDQWIMLRLPFPRIFSFAEVCLRGIGQVYFCNSPLTGLCFSAAILYQSPIVAVHGWVALVSGTLFAYKCDFDHAMIGSGLFGYNAVLIGLALSSFAEVDQTSPSQQSIVTILFSSAFFACFTCICFQSLGKLLVPYGVPPMTLPFDLTTIMFLAASTNMAYVNPAPSSTTYMYDPSTDISATALAAGVLRGVGQVLFCDQIASCVLVVLGIALCSRVLVLAALGGSLLGAVTGIVTGISAQEIELGTVGLPTSLTVTCMFLFYMPGWNLVFLATMAGVTTVFAQQALLTLLADANGLPYMSLPFCLVILPFVILQGTTNLVLPVPLAAVSIPEDHQERVRILREGFAMLHHAIDDDDDDSDLKSLAQHRGSLREVGSSSQEAVSYGSFAGRRSLTLPTRLGLNVRQQVPLSESLRTRARDIFTLISSEKADQEVNAADFESALRCSGLTEPGGMRFAMAVFLHLDVDDSGTISFEEFLRLCGVSQSLGPLRYRLSLFLEFVDRDQNGGISLGEIDASLDSLGEGTLSHMRRDSIARMANLESADDEVDPVELTNLITAASIKKLAMRLRCATPRVESDEFSL